MFTSDLSHRNASLEEKLRRLYDLNRVKKIDLSFRPPFLNLLKALGDPHKKLPPVIHVAGTNGKGSIIATLRSVLESAGYRVHAYTSPHLVSFNERIYLAGKDIGDAYLESLTDKVLRLNRNSDITFFEITTALAFAAFAETPADILLLETGMGGRLDATNMIENPLVTIISAIGIDHVEHLGDTLEKIAFEKAGIMKPSVPCVIASQTATEVASVFEARARQLNAPLFRADAEWFSETKNGQMHFVFNPVPNPVDMSLPLPNLKGSHQIGNSGAALAALKVIAERFPVSEDAVHVGLRNIAWPARMQNVTPLLPDMPQGWEVWLDGGHNENAARILSKQAEYWAQKDGKPLHLVLGMMNHKDPRPFVNALRPYMKSLSLIDIPGEPKAYSAQALAHILPGATASADYRDAVQAIIRSAGASGRILVTGSLYLAGHVLKTAARKPHNEAQESLTHAA